MTTRRRTVCKPLVLIAAALAMAPAVRAQDAAQPVDRTLDLMPIDPAPIVEDADGIGVEPVETGAGNLPSALLHVPFTGVFPNAVRPDIEIVNPVADDPEAAYRGMGYFNQFNCVGCHAPNGAGGMGPSLSNATFKYGSDPGHIYLTILQGRPLGMPAFGSILPDHIIWDLAAYLRAISKDDTGQWGKTTSLEHFTIEQVPAQYQTTVNPWDHTQPFSYGRPPFLKVETPEKPE